MGVLNDRYNRKLMQPAVDTAGVVTQPVQPQVDTSNAIGSLAELMGPTPAEREERERRMQEQKSKMMAWTGLFDGLRQLGNLYYTSKGASPQKYSDNLYGQVEQQYQQQRQMADAMDNYRRQYAQGMYSLRRQMEDDRRRNRLAEAQANYYDSRDEMARQKAELEKLKAVRVIKQKDGSLMKFDPVSGAIEPLTDSDPLYVEYVQSQINKNNRSGKGTGGRSNSGTTTTEITYNEDGKPVKRVVHKGGGSNTSTAQKGKKTIKGYKKSGSSTSSTSKGKAY